MSDGTIPAATTSAPDVAASAAAASSAAPTSPPAGGAQSLAQQDAAAKNWYDDFKPSPEAVSFLQEKKYTDFNTFAASAMEADRLARSRNVLEKPAPDKILEWQGWEHLGWKPKLDDYALKPAKMDGAPDEMIGLAGEFTSLVRNIAHAARVPLPAAQMIADQLAGKLAEFDKALSTKDAAARAAETEKLRSEWGQDYSRNEELARRAFQHFAKGDEAAMAELIAIGSPRVMKIFAEIGKSIGEDQLVTAGGAPLPQSLDALAAQLRQFRHENKAIMQDQSHIRHKDVLAAYEQLSMRKANAEIAARGK